MNSRLQRRLLHDCVALIISNLGAATLAVAASVLIGRSLGAARFGLWAWSIAWARALALVCESGPNALLTCEIARSPAPNQIRMACVLGLSTA